MKILAFAGSTSSTSINRELVKFVLKDFQNEEINLIDLNDFDMPVFSVDREKKGFPDEAHHFLKVIEDCDVIICSLAEHNRSYSAAFKNVFDWASRINVKVFQNKPMFLMSTSPGGYYENFDLETGVINPEMLKDLKNKIESFKAQVNQ
jgi:NAD(P)H-dependent FMN reductase